MVLSGFEWLPLKTTQNHLWNNTFLVVVSGFDTSGFEWF